MEAITRLTNELQHRLAAMRERAKQRAFVTDRAAYVRTVPILAALEASGDDYDSFDYGRLRGRLNDWAHAPDEHPFVVSSYTKIPPDPAERDAAIMAAVARLAGDAPAVTVILRREDMALLLPLPVLARHIRTLIDSAGVSEIGFAVPPGDDIIEVNPLGIAVGRLRAA